MFNVRRTTGAGNTHNDGSPPEAAGRFPVTPVTGRPSCAGLPHQSLHSAIGPRTASSLRLPETDQAVAAQIPPGHRQEKGVSALQRTGDFAFLAANQAAGAAKSGSQPVGDRSQPAMADGHKYGYVAGLGRHFFVASIIEDLTGRLSGTTWTKSATPSKWSRWCRRRC